MFNLNKMDYLNMELSKLLATSLLLSSFVCSANQTKQELALSKDLTLAVKQINENGAQLLDAETRLDSAATFSNYIIYNNTMVNYTADQFDVNSFNPIIQEAVIDTLCANPGLKSFIELGVVMVYRYHGKNGHFISELSKDMSTCKKS